MKKARRPAVAVRHDSMEVAATVLGPVVAFLARAGVGKTDIESAVRNVYAHQKPAKKTVKLTTLRDSEPFVNLVATWTREANYLDASGEPRDLSIRGRYGFASLARQAAPGIGAQRALEVLKDYGNIQRLENRRVRLVRPFFHIRGENTLAFEPSVRFLLDAASNVRKSSQRESGNSDPTKGHFWRSVDTRTLPREMLSSYLSFVKEHSLAFLQDVDAWLLENASTEQAKRRQRRVRVGVGLFTFESGQKE
ncbi:MAG: hypothetical protein EOP84_19675 [Verrucomicrobiaceae bacterium]|nr:MAG: hypothetical protein EOP84_19675 [Verrucomicrobiaceae bacterium]